VGVDEAYVASELARAKLYTIVYLRRGPAYEDHPARDAITFEHVKRNFDMKLAGDLAVVGPTRSEGEVVGIYIFNVDRAAAARLIEEDPAVAAGIFTYEAQDLMAFPGDALA
jgi:hypothetical protein